MYAHLLVPLDGSAAAEAALAHVQALAERFSARVTLIRVTVAPETLIAEAAGGAPGIPDAGPMIDPTPVLEEEHEQASTYLGRITERLRSGGLQQVQAGSPEGHAAHTIVARARELRAD